MVFVVFNDVDVLFGMVYVVDFSKVVVDGSYVYKVVSFLDLDWMLDVSWDVVSADVLVVFKVKII